MAEVKVVVNGRSYSIACDDGEEAHLTELAGHVDQRVAELAGSLGQIGEGRLLLMTSLLIADELAEIKERHSTAEVTSKDVAQNAADVALASSGDAAAAMTAAAAQLEDIAARLENA